MPTPLPKGFEEVTPLPDGFEEMGAGSTPLPRGFEEFPDPEVMRAQARAETSVARAGEIRAATGFPSLTEARAAATRAREEISRADREKLLTGYARQIANFPVESGFDLSIIPGFREANREQRLAMLLAPENMQFVERMELQNREEYEKAVATAEEARKRLMVGAMTAMSPFTYTYQTISQVMGGDNLKDATDIAAKHTLEGILAPYASPELMQALQNDPGRLMTAGQAALKALKKYGIEGHTAVALASLGEVAAQMADPLFFTESAGKILGKAIDKQLAKDLDGIFSITNGRGVEPPLSTGWGEAPTQYLSQEPRQVLERRLRSGEITYADYQKELAAIPTKPVAPVRQKPPNLLETPAQPGGPQTLQTPMTPKPVQGQMLTPEGEFALSPEANRPLTPSEQAEIAARRAAEAQRSLESVQAEIAQPAEPAATSQVTQEPDLDAIRAQIREAMPEATPEQIEAAIKEAQASLPEPPKPVEPPKPSGHGHTGKPLVQNKVRGVHDPVLVRYADADQQLLDEIHSKRMAMYKAGTPEARAKAQDVLDGLVGLARQRMGLGSAEEVLTAAAREADAIKAQVKAMPKTAAEYATASKPVYDESGKRIADLDLVRAAETEQAQAVNLFSKKAQASLDDLTKRMEELNAAFEKNKLNPTTGVNPESYRQQYNALSTLFDAAEKDAALSAAARASNAEARARELAWRDSPQYSAYLAVQKSGISKDKAMQVLGIDSDAFDRIVPPHLRRTGKKELFDKKTGKRLGVEYTGLSVEEIDDPDILSALGTTETGVHGGMAGVERLRELVRIGTKPDFAVGLDINPDTLIQGAMVKDLLADTPLGKMAKANQAAVDLTAPVEPIPQLGMDRDRVASIIREVNAEGRPDVEVAGEALSLMKVWSAEDMMKGIDPPAPAGPGTAWRLDTMSAAVVARNVELAEQLGGALVDLIRTRPVKGVKPSPEHLAALQKAFGYSTFYDQFLKLADKNLRREVGAALRQFRILEEGFSKEAAAMLRKGAAAETQAVRETMDKFAASQAAESREWLQKWGKDLLPGQTQLPASFFGIGEAAKIITKIVDPELWYHISVVGGEVLVKGARTFGAWSVQMAKEAGGVWTALSEGAKRDAWERLKAMFSRSSLRSQKEAAEALERTILSEAEMTGIVDPELADSWMSDRAVKRMQAREAKGENVSVTPDGETTLSRAQDRDARVVTSRIYGDMVKRGLKVDEEAWASKMLEVMGEGIRPFIRDLQGAAKTSRIFTKDARSKVVLDQLKREGYKFGLDTPENMMAFAQKYAAYMKNPEELGNAIFRSKRQGFLDWLAGTAVISKLTSPALYLGNLVANEGRAVMQAVAVEAGGDIAFANRLFGGKAQMRPGEGVAYYLARWRSPASVATKDGLRDLFRSGGIRKAWSNTMKDLDRIAQGEVLGESKAADVFTPGVPSFLAPAPWETGKKLALKKGVSRVESIPRWALETGDRHYFEATQYARIYETGFREARAKGLSFGNSLRAADAFVDSPAGKAMLEQAQIHAREAVFREEFGQGWMDQAISKLGSVSRIPVIGKLLLPFYRTSVNISKQGFRYGLPLSPRNIQDLMAGGLTKEEAIGRMAVGTMAGGTAYYLWSSGIVTGEGPSDATDKRAWEAAGNVRNSFRTDFGPVPLRAVGDVPARMLTPWINLFEQVHYRNLDPQGAEVTKMVGAILKDATRTNLTSTAKTIDDLLQFQGRGDDALKGVALGYIPTLLKWGAYVSDETVRETGDLEESAAARTFGFSKGASPRLTPLGAEQKRSRLAAVFGFEVIEKPESTEKWLGELGVHFDQPSKYVEGEKVATEDINKIKIERRSLVLPFLESLRKGGSLEKMTKEERQFVVDFVVNQAYPNYAPAVLTLKGKYSAKAAGITGLTEEQHRILGGALKSQGAKMRWEMGNRESRAALVRELVEDSPGTAARR